MGLGEKVLLINDFSGGLNLKDSPYYLKDNEAAECTNLVFDRTGRADVRAGYTLYGDTLAAAPIRGMHRFYTPTLKQLLVAAGTDIYLGDDATGSFVSKKTGLTPGLHYGFATWDYKKLALITNGTDPLMQWDGTTIANVSGSPPTGRYIVIYANRAWVAGDRNSPTTLRWSALGDHTNWPTENFAEAKGPITGLGAGFGQLFIFEPNRIEVLVGTGGVNTTEGINTLVDGIGCVAPGSLASWGGLWVFLAADGVYTFDGAHVNKVSDNVDPVFRFGQTAQQRDEAVGVVHNGRYWLAWRESGYTYNNVVYVYSLSGKWWTKFDNMEITSFVQLGGTQDDAQLLSGDGSGRVFWQETGKTDNGKEIIATWLSKIFVPVPGYACQFRKMSFEMLSMDGPLTLEWFVEAASGSKQFDPHGSGSNWNDFNWDEGVWADVESHSHNLSFTKQAVGRSLQVNIRQESHGDWHALSVLFWPKRKVK